MTNETANPLLPALYFLGKDHTNDNKNSALENSPFQTLPPEMVQHCLAGFCEWGDLAKLSTVHPSWRNLVRDAATHGGHEAKWELAEALLSGSDGLERNPALAVRYLTDLAGVTLEGDETGRRMGQPASKKDPFAPAMRKLATCYFTGDGVDANRTMGIRWLEAAHEDGKDVDAAHELAVVYEYGEHDVDVDVVLAADYFRTAAEGGHVEAMAEYAMCCELGCGREQSDEDALHWYMKAANEGHVTANFSVGEAFEEARGVPQSDEEACLWYYKAAVEGDEDSKKALHRLEDIARIVLPGVGGLLNA